MFVALSLFEAGYTVFANARMRNAGVYVMPQLSIATGIQRDWNEPPGVAGLLNL